MSKKRKRGTVKRTPIEGTPRKREGHYRNFPTPTQRMEGTTKGGKIREDDNQGEQE